MKTKFFTTMASITNESERNFNAVTISELLEQLVAHYGNKLEKKLYPKDDGVLNENIVIMVNGKSIKHLQGLNTALKEDDKVSLFPMVSGG